MIGTGTERGESRNRGRLERRLRISPVSAPLPKVVESLCVPLVEFWKVAGSLAQITTSWEFRCLSKLLPGSVLHRGDSGPVERLAARLVSSSDFKQNWSIWEATGTGSPLN